MLPFDTLKELQNNQSALVKNITDTLTQSEVDAVAVPATINIIDLEKYRDTRRRLSGTMATDDLDSLQAYVKAFGVDGAVQIFVQPNLMTASALLNFGGIDVPGHCDHLANFAPDKSPDYAAMLKVAGGEAKRHAQKAAAEWCEDYTHCITFLDGDSNQIDPARAIKAIRNIKIEHTAKAASGVGSFQAEKSLLESTKVDTSDGLPHFIEYTCTPYAILQERTFRIRLGTASSNGETIFVLQIIKLDQHVFDMAQELAALIRTKMDGIPVMLGKLTK